MKLIPISAQRASELDPIEFPLQRQYLGMDYRGMYWGSQYQWFFIQDMRFRDPVVGCACLTQNKLLPGSLHISVFEIKSSLQGRGLGTEAMWELLNYAGGEFLSATLRPKFSELVGFYRKVGFKPTWIDGALWMRKYQPLARH